MAAGDTTTGSLADSLNTMVADARQVREHEGTMPQLVDKKTLAKGTGLNWNEVDYATLTAMTGTETTDFDNPQQLIDTNLQIIPSLTSVMTFLTDRVKARIASVAFSQIGTLAQNAIQRKKDEDGLTVLDSATTSLAGSGTTLVSGHIQAAISRIESDADEPGPPPYRIVLHGFQIKDISAEIEAGIGTFAIADGLTATVFREDFKGLIHGGQVFRAGNLALTGTDVKGGVFAMKGIVLVQGRMPWTKTREEPHKGGGGTSIWLYDEYAYGERSPGNWLYEIFSDATAPTS